MDLTPNGALTFVIFAHVSFSNNFRDYFMAFMLFDLFGYIQWLVLVLGKGKIQKLT